VGLLVTQAADDPWAQARLGALTNALQEAGWTNGGNIRIEARWASGSAYIRRKYAVELAALRPDAVVTVGSGTTQAMLAATRTVPIVFTIVPDPVAEGIVDSLSRPGGNVTGFTSYEYNTSAKWLELLKQVAPDVTRVAVLHDRDLSTGAAQFAAIEAIAPKLGVSLYPIGVRDAEQINQSINDFARQTNGALLVSASALALVHRKLILALATRYRLPVFAANTAFAQEGGLISYGPDLLEQFRQAAGYVDRILRGEAPAVLPVQSPTRYELVINVKTANMLGLTIPPSLLVTADQVIE
jgi:putative ABC transport system substrate-binding protein